MAKLLQELTASKSDELALVDDRRETTWGELGERVDRLINGLTAAGVAPGDTVAMMMGNRRRSLRAVLGRGPHWGSPTCPVNWHWVADELAYVIDDSGATALVVGDRFADVAAEALGRPPCRAGRPGPRCRRIDPPRPRPTTRASWPAPTAEPRSWRPGRARCSTPRAPPVAPRVCGGPSPVARTSPVRCSQLVSAGIGRVRPAGRADPAGRSRLPLGPVGVRHDADGQRLGGRDAPQVRRGRDRST